MTKSFFFVKQNEYLIQESVPKKIHQTLAPEPYNRFNFESTAHIALR